jgi:hypothetical protein
VYEVGCVEDVKGGKGVEGIGGMLTGVSFIVSEPGCEAL